MGINAQRGPGGSTRSTVPQAPLMAAGRGSVTILACRSCGLKYAYLAAVFGCQAVPVPGGARPLRTASVDGRQSQCHGSRICRACRACRADRPARIVGGSSEIFHRLRPRSHQRSPVGALPVSSPGQHPTRGLQGLKSPCLVVADVVGKGRGGRDAVWALPARRVAGPWRHG